MAELPETRESLLLRVRDPANAEAWERFVELYRPGVYRLARRAGLQDSDADDLAQGVFLSVSQAIGGWQKDPTRGTFRAWLVRTSRNAIINVFTRRRPDLGQGGSSVLERLHHVATDEDAVARLIDDEYRRALFRSAADDVRAEFQEGTWLAFERTTIDGVSIEAAATEIGKSVGSVYAARSRVMRRLKERVRELETAD